MCYLLSKLDGDFVYKTDDCFIKNLYIERDFFRGGAGGGMVTFAWLSWRYDWLFKVIIFGFTFECLSLHCFDVKSKIAWKIDQNRILKGLSAVLLLSTVSIHSCLYSYFHLEQFLYKRTEKPNTH